jgi:hypothetical protein
MDVPSNIAGLGSLADLVFAKSFWYIKAVKNADKDVASFSSEIQGLAGILHSLYLVASHLDDENYDRSARVHHLHSCYETLEKARTRLQEAFPETNKKSCAASSLAKLKWPFSIPETKGIIADIHRHKLILNLALSVDNLSSLLTVLGRQAVLQDGINGIKRDLRKRWDQEDRAAYTRDRRKTLEFFGKVDPQYNHDLSLRLRHPGTGLWSVLISSSIPCVNIRLLNCNVYALHAVTKQC